jgi:hypothetical protein
MPIEMVALTYIKMAQWVSLRCGKPKPPMRRPHRSPCNLFSAIKSPRNLSLCCALIESSILVAGSDFWHTQWGTFCAIICRTSAPWIVPCGTARFCGAFTCWWLRLDWLAGLRGFGTPKRRFACPPWHRLGASEPVAEFDRRSLEHRNCMRRGPTPLSCAVPAHYICCPPIPRHDVRSVGWLSIVCDHKSLILFDCLTVSSGAGNRMAGGC